MLRRCIKCAIPAVILFLCSCQKSDTAKNHFDKAYKYSQEKKYAQSFDEYDTGFRLEAVNQEAGSAENHIRYGNALEDYGDVDSAITQYKKALERRPKHINARIELANAYRKKGLLDEATHYMKEAVELKPGEGWIRNVFGNILEESGKQGAALREYEEAARLDPNEPEFRTDLANTYLKLGRKNDALQEYRYVSRLLEGVSGENTKRDYKKEAQYAHDMIELLTTPASIE